MGLARRIDHVVIETGDEDALFGFFVSVLGLPVAWPIARWGRLREGGVNTGNCNIGCNHMMNAEGDPAPALTMLALQPAGDIEAVHSALADRGLSPIPPITGDAKDLPDQPPYAPWRLGWTIVVLDCPHKPLPFFCSYAHDMDGRAASERAQFEEHGGGPFRITELQALVIGVGDVSTAVQQWSDLLDDISAVRAGMVSLAGGPELRFEPGPSPVAVVFGTRSLDQAQDAARDLGLRYELTGSQLTLDSAQTLGLDIRFETPGRIVST